MVKLKPSHLSNPSQASVYKEPQAIDEMPSGQPLNRTAVRPTSTKGQKTAERPQV